MKRPTKQDIESLVGLVLPSVSLAVIPKVVATALSALCMG
jgi:hypothetical protein